jgi:hypothetical protein
MPLKETKLCVLFYLSLMIFFIEIFFFINVDVRVSLLTPRLIPRALKLTTM